MKNKSFKKLALALFVALIFLTKGTSTVDKVNADTPFPSGTITATYDSAAGQLNTSGNYAWNLCNSTNKKKWAGFALFINGAFPSASTPDSRALDGTGMHLANGGNACTTDPGSWSDTHILTSAPTSVCVVVYDVEINTGAPNVGDRSETGAGKDFNEDNSYHNNGDSYATGDCTVPTVITPTPTLAECDKDCVTSTPTLTSTPTPTPTQTPNIGGLGDGLSDGRSDGRSSSPQPIKAVLGLSATGSGSNMYLELMQLMVGFAFSATGFIFFKKNA